MKATLTVYFNREPKEIIVEKPAGEWMAFDAFLKSVGFRRSKYNGLRIDGRFKFVSFSEDEIEAVIAIVKSGGNYLTSGNLDYTFQI